MLMSYGIEQKILAYNGDNATSNDTQTAELSILPNSFHEVNRARCFNHTLQLSAKSLLRPFNSAISSASEEAADLYVDMPALAEDSDDEDDDDNNNDDNEAAGYDDLDGDDLREDVDELAALDEGAREELLSKTAEVRSTLTKVRRLSFVIIHSTTIALPAWHDACRSTKMPVRMIPRDVTTRWNSTYDMVSFALKYRQPIDNIMGNKVLKLPQYELDVDDWKITEDLCIHCCRSTRQPHFFLQESVSTIANVIPTMDSINDMLSGRTVQNYHPAIQSAMQLARATMNRYYSKTDLSSVYRITMVLHPGLKLEYFKKREWDPTWIDAAENLTREEYIGTYEDAIVPIPIPAVHAGVSADADVSDNDEFAEFRNISLSGLVTVRNEIDDYLAAPLENVQDPLKWWYDNRQAYPKLSRMGLDYLSIPVTSTAVERTFSQGRQLLHFTRNRMMPSTIRASLCLGSWGHSNLLCMEDLIAAVAPKKVSILRMTTERQ
ncbi:putative AC9 transposase [Sparassis crispa]|uniref:Putative AC9 transposase n=1 Tax=Sparassis crispa TaxID=139825 RepID=A0A401GZK5_9APHY|nr:putative AC9 transposase [Sparassis crispa]GBE87594.1 putative AC9 transposase [Sparassis crispa]